MTIAPPPQPPTQAPIPTTDTPASPPAQKAPADILRHAALILEETGWCQGMFTAPDGRHCMVGALMAANDYSTVDLNRPTTSPIHKAEVALYKAGYGIGWNDRTGRTEAEVIAALRETADKLA